MNLLFIEWPEQIDALASQKVPLSDFTVIATTVTAAAYCLEMGIDYIPLDNQLDYDRYLKETNLGYEILEKQCDDLDGVIYQIDPEIEQAHIRPFFYNFYYLKIWTDQVKWLNDCIQALITHLKPLKISYFSGTTDLIDDAHYWPIAYPLISKVLDKEFNHLEKTILPFDYTVITSHRAENDGYSDKILKVISQPLWKRILRKVSTITSRSFVRNHSGCYFSSAAWIPTSLDKKLNLRKHQISFNKITKPFLKESDKIDAPIYAKLLEIFDGGHLAIVWPKIKKHILDKLPYYLTLQRDLETLIHQHDPEFFELVCGAQSEDKILADMFKRKGKKVLILQHGALGQHIEKMYKYVDFTVATDYFVYGLGVKKYITTHYPNLIKNINVIGNNKTPRKNIDKKGLCDILNFNPELPIFLFQISAVLGNAYYNTFNSDGDIFEYTRLRKLIDFFSTRPDLQLILKGHPGERAQANPISNCPGNLSLPNVRSINNVPLIELHHASDFFITDRPSTGMLEAMSNEKTILAYNPIIQFWGDDASLQKETHFFRDFADFIKFMNSADFSAIKKIRTDYTAYKDKFMGDSNFEKKLRPLLDEIKTGEKPHAIAS